MVVYTGGQETPRLCVVDGVAKAVLVGFGRRTMRVTPDRTAAGALGRPPLTRRVSGRELTQGLPQSTLPMINGINLD